MAQRAHYPKGSALFICGETDMQIGRRTIFTDVEKITNENVVTVLANAMSDFLANASDCDRLLNIEAGYMPLTREKKVRTDIDVQTVDNIANEITEFKRSFHWGIPFTFIQRGTHDSGKEDEVDAITELNECYAAENLGKKQNTLGRFVEICGIGYTFIDIKPNWTEGDSYFQYEVLDPRFAFVIRSSRYADHRIMLGVTFRIDKMGNKYFTCFTDDRRYEIVCGVIKNGDEVKEEWTKTKRSGEVNPLGRQPIVEWERSSDRMGVFEREIPELNRINLLLSDIGNDVENETQAIWHTNDVEFPHVLDENGNPTEEYETPKSNEWVSTFTSRDGRQPFIKPLTTNYNYDGLLRNYVQARAMVLQRCYTPQRNDDSGGSTGVAMSDATGWSAAEQVANAQQLIMESSKMDEVKAVLAAIKKNPKVPADSPLLKLRYMDVKPNILRSKNFELSVKSTSLANLLSHGIYGLHALKAVNLFEDVMQVWTDSKDIIEQYQNSIFKEKEEVQKTSDLPEYQIGNSPLIDGMSKEVPIDAEEKDGKGDKKAEEKDKKNVEEKKDKKK